MPLRLLILGSILIIAMTPSHAQVGTPIPSPFPGPDDSFEVASVKPKRSGGEQWDFDSPPGRVVGTNVVLRDLIRFGYNIYGGDWDIRIDAPGGSRSRGSTSMQRRQMLCRKLGLCRCCGDCSQSALV